MKTGTVYRQVLLVEDGSDDGDGYDYSPLKKDFVLTSRNVSAKISVADYGYLSKASIMFTMNVDNQAKDHRVHVMVPNKLSGKCSVSDNQFGSIKRPVIDEAMSDCQKMLWAQWYRCTGCKSS